MTYSLVTVDTETNGFDYTKLLCVAVKPRGGLAQLFSDVKEFEDWCEKYTDENTYWVGHNICGFDYWVIKDLTKVHITKSKVIDTSVLSRLMDYGRFQTHSLKEIGEHIGVYKGDYTGGFEEFTPEMGDYCVQDAIVADAIYHWLLKQKTPNPSAWAVEHEMAFICAEMKQTGFNFNKEKAEDLLNEVKRDMSLIEGELQKAYPPKLVEDRRIQWRVKSDGTPYATCLKAMKDAPKWERDGDELVLYKYQEFSPGSPKQRIDVLWDAGWQPYDKTKGHIQHQRSKRSWH